MKTLLWIGNPFFHAGMERHGWRVIFRLPQGNEYFTWRDCLELAGGAPDAVLVADTSHPPFVLGVEKFPCLTLFYAVDTHIHSWMPLYGQAFDACLISLRDHIPLFAGQRLPQERLWWFPPYAPDSPEDFPAGPRKWDCLFVGTVDRARTPLRFHFLEHLAGLMPALTVKQGHFARLYPRARLVVNICEHGDLNFRVFESLGCGASLVTPAVGHGLTELFRPDHHFLTFEAAFWAQDRPLPDDEARRLGRLAAAEAAPRIQSLLDNPARCESMARAGWDEVKRRHRARHRAQALARALEKLPPDLPRQRCDQAGAVRHRYLRLMYLLW
ncbi:MAG: glycosyltransferase family 1 protein, partial [Desulfovibrionaceae bacterium]|nr:glycosyltransferase family 1 protein [Desulfovibrionaceae bacterium]